MIRFMEDNLQDQPWVTQKGVDVNSVIAEGFQGSHTPKGYLKVTNDSSAAMGGGLVTCKRPYPSYGTIPLPYIQLRKDFFISDDELYNLARKEFDVKTVYKSGEVTPIANMANFSTQWNASNGEWQLDPTGTIWVDTGFKPVIVPNVWTSVVYNFVLDVLKQTWGVISVTWGGQFFALPGMFQSLPLIKTNWAVVSALQAQTEVFNPGSLTTLYDNISLAYSDQTF